MSAYIEPHRHIATLARWAVENDIRYFYNGATKTLIQPELSHGDELYAYYADMLERQNVLSVDARYNDLHTFRVYRHKDEGIPSHSIPLKDIAMAVSGYCYQACETDDWHETDAYWLTQAIKDTILRKITEGSECWSIDDKQKELVHN